MERLNVLCIDVFSNARVHCDIRIVRGKMYGGVIANASRRAWGNRDDETSETEDRMNHFPCIRLFKSVSAYLSRGWRR
jgi:hypothetical protein